MVAGLATGQQLPTSLQHNSSPARWLFQGVLRWDPWKLRSRWTTSVTLVSAASIRHANPQWPLGTHERPPPRRSQDPRAERHRPPWAKAARQGRAPVRPGQMCRARPRCPFATPGRPPQTMHDRQLRQTHRRQGLGLLPTASRPTPATRLGRMALVPRAPPTPGTSCGLRLVAAGRCP